jgi:hypothetical protein
MHSSSAWASNLENIGMERRPTPRDRQAYYVDKERISHFPATRLDGAYMVGTLN